MSNDIKIGIIGGSGIYDLDNIKIIEEKQIDTPFGSPSGKYVIGSLNDIKIAFLPRHGKGHKILPSELNNRANIYGFKILGVDTLIGVSAVGSLREEIKPRDLVFPNQLIDRTKGRASTFFGEGIVAHVGFAEPFCSNLIKIFEKEAKALNIDYHSNKTYICMEGPAFSTKAESNFHRMIGGDIIGMTASPEAKLAREAEMCYATIALSTDYDCWRENEEVVTVEMVIENMNKNIISAKKLLSNVIPKIKNDNCPCRSSLSVSIITQKDLWPQNTKTKLEAILKKYF
jgi:5'-methylthioadenosine phosphorylase